jgi:Glycosyltransferase family 17
MYRMVNMPATIRIDIYSLIAVAYYIIEGMAGSVKLYSLDMLRLSFVFYIPMYIAVVHLTIQGCFCEANKIPIVDLIMFNGEEMAHLRMLYLEDAVDLFVLVESKQTFSGIMKKNYYLDTKSSMFQHLPAKKILQIRIEYFPSQLRQQNITWEREMYQRDYAVSQILNQMQHKKFIMLGCDSDGEG